MIEARGLGKIYSDGTVGLRDLDLVVNPGMIYVLLGANGAGKTTTMNLFLNFVSPTSGRAFVAGVDVFSEPIRSKRHLAALSENVLFYPSLSGRQNLRFFAKLAGKTLDREGLDHVLRQAGLPDDSFGRAVGKYSKGMRQKLGFAIVMLRDASALIMDEPMTGLDPKAVNDLIQALEGFRDSGKAILVSTHDLFRAKLIGDRIGVMRSGRLVAEWSRDDLAGKDLEVLYLQIMSSLGEGKASE